jgi:hypothetical protein
MRPSHWLPMMRHSVAAGGGMSPSGGGGGGGMSLIAQTVLHLPRQVGRL